MVIALEIAVLVRPFKNALACVVEPLEDACRTDTLNDPRHGIVQWMWWSVEGRPADAANLVALFIASEFAECDPVVTLLCFA